MRLLPEFRSILTTLPSDYAPGAVTEVVYWEAAPRMDIRLTHPGQTPAQYAECFGYALVPPNAWQPEHMKAAQRMAEQGADPNRIALFVVPGGGR